MVIVQQQEPKKQDTTTTTTTTTLIKTKNVSSNFKNIYEYRASIKIVDKIWALIIGKEIRTRYLYIIKCVIIIQRKYKQYKTWKSMLRFMHAITLLQAMIRGKKARLDLNIIRTRNLLKEESEKLQIIRAKEKLYLSAIHDYIFNETMNKIDANNKKSGGRRLRIKIKNYNYPALMDLNLDTSRIYPEGWNQAFAQIFKKIFSENREIRQIEIGGNFTAILDNKSNVFTFGWNDKGQLAHGHYKACPYAVEVEFLRRQTSAVKCLSAGEEHLCVLLEDGRVYTSGSNKYGQLGYDTGKSISGSSLHQVNISLKVRNISSGMYHSVASLVGSPKIYEWGTWDESQQQELKKCNNININNYNNNVNDISSNSNNHRNSNHRNSSNSNQQWWKPRCIQIGSGTLQLFAQGRYTIILGKNHKVYAWGVNIYGQLGLGVKHRTVHRPTVVCPPGSKNFLLRSISVGNHHTLGVTLHNQEVVGWGSNKEGQLGFEDKEILYHPVHLKCFKKCKAEETHAGLRHSLVLLEDKQLMGMGYVGVVPGKYDNDMTPKLQNGLMESYLESFSTTKPINIPLFGCPFKKEEADFKLSTCSNKYMSLTFFTVRDAKADRYILLNEATKSHMDPTGNNFLSTLREDKKVVNKRKLKKEILVLTKEKDGTVTPKSLSPKGRARALSPSGKEIQKKMLKKKRQQKRAPHIGYERPKGKVIPISRVERFRLKAERWEKERIEEEKKVLRIKKDFHNTVFLKTKWDKVKEAKFDVVAFLTAGTKAQRYQEHKKRAKMNNNNSRMRNISGAIKSIEYHGIDETSPNVVRRILDNNYSDRDEDEMALQSISDEDDSDSDREYYRFYHGNNNRKSDRDIQDNFSIQSTNQEDDLLNEPQLQYDQMKTLFQVAEKGYNGGYSPKKVNHPPQFHKETKETNETNKRIRGFGQPASRSDKRKVLQDKYSLSSSRRYR